MYPKLTNEELSERIQRITAIMDSNFMPNPLSGPISPDERTALNDIRANLRLELAQRVQVGGPNGCGCCG